MLNASAEADPYASLAPPLRDQVEDAAVSVALTLKNTPDGKPLEVPQGLPAKVQNWIRANAAEFSASVIRHYRRLEEAG